MGMTIDADTSRTMNSMKTEQFRTTCSAGGGPPRGTAARTSVHCGHAGFRVWYMYTDPVHVYVHVWYMYMSQSRLSRLLLYPVRPTPCTDRRTRYMLRIGGAGARRCAQPRSRHPSPWPTYVTRQRPRGYSVCSALQLAHLSTGVHLIQFPNRKSL